MNEDPTGKVDAQDAEQVYVAPELAPIGSVRELTMGVTGPATDGDGQILTDLI
jgi:hypothetical protein